MTDHKCTAPQDPDHVLTPDEIERLRTTGTLCDCQVPDTQISPKALEVVERFEAILEELVEVAPEMPNATLCAFFCDGQPGSETQGLTFAPSSQTILTGLLSAVANTIRQAEEDSEHNRKAIIIHLMTLLDQPLTDELIADIRTTMYSIAAHGEESPLIH